MLAIYYVNLDRCDQLISNNEEIKDGGAAMVMIYEAWKFEVSE
jgi:hypothetical protein